MSTLRKWWWVPLLGALICCLLTGLLAARFAAGKAKDGSLAALDGAGLGSSVNYVGVDGLSGFGSDGLNVALEGPASAEAAAVAAVENRSEVRRVDYRVTDEGAGDAAATTDSDDDADDDADDPPVVDLDPAAVSIAAAGTGVVLQGTVPDDETRDELIAAAVNEYGAANVEHELVVDPAAIAPEGGVLTLTGAAVSDTQRDDWFAMGSAVAQAGGLDVVDEITVTSVDQSLNDLFALEPIEFDTNQATIRASSQATLDAAAELIKANPDVGRLNVIGHTDSDGNSSTNQRLSEARAAAVVAYLVDNGEVDAARLEAEGKGETALLVDPEISPEDKQRNRRIEWELLS